MTDIQKLHLIDGKTLEVGVDHITKISDCMGWYNGYIEDAQKFRIYSRNVMYVEYFVDSR